MQLIHDIRCSSDLRRLINEVHTTEKDLCIALCNHTTDTFYIESLDQYIVMGDKSLSVISQKVSELGNILKQLNEKGYTFSLNELLPSKYNGLHESLYSYTVCKGGTLIIRGREDHISPIEGLLEVMGRSKIADELISAIKTH